MTEERRKVLGWISGCLGGCALLTAGAPVLGFLSNAVRRKRQTRAFDLGDAAALPDGQFRLVTFTYEDETGYTRRPRILSAYLRRDGERVLALSPICTHLRCNVAWDGASKGFMCPCHGGMFDSEGRVTKGPPVEPLFRFPIEIKSGSMTLIVPESYKG